MPRKTFDVQSFKDYVNEFLENENIPFAVKDGMISALDHVLHSTGNYKGFRYLDSYNGEDPEFGMIDDPETGFPINQRKTVRRQYF